VGGDNFSDKDYVVARGFLPFQRALEIRNGIGKWH
jgi:hypothetical protein